MLKIKRGKLAKIVFVSSLLFLISSCSNDLEPVDWTLSFDTQLTKDSNGYYHLTVDRNNWQTLHRVTGQVETIDGVPIENFWVEWESNLYWYLGDTLGYIVNRYFNSLGTYVTVDTSYIIGFNGMEVPTTNQISYSNGTGEINNMIAPVKSMVGDTMVLKASWYNDSVEFGIVLE